MLEIPLALLAALLFALGTVLQQKASLDAPSTAEGSHAGLLLRMARRPTWLAGVGADVLGFAAQAVALTVGRIAVVQPLLVASVVFALPLGARLTGQRVGRRDVGGAVLVTVALAAFLLVANPAGGRPDAPLRGWAIGGALLGGGSALLALAARGAHPKARAALLGAGAGLLFALSAALTKAVGDQVRSDLPAVLAHWQPYALALVGYASMTLNQLALATGALAPAIATATAVDPVASVVLGIALFDETLAPSALAAAVGALALAAALAGVVLLAHEWQPPALTRGARRASA